MAPFASLNGFWLVPLAVNSACLIGTLLVVQRLLFSRFKAGQLSSWLLASFLAFCLNIYGLVFTGMEHSLQVLLAAIIADSVTRRKVNILLWVSLLILPLIRYEGLAISAPVLFYLACQGRATRSKSLATGLLLAIGLLSFSAFLGSLGLGYLPSSVFAKQSATTADSAFSLFEIMAQTAIENIRSRPTFTIYFIATISGFLAWSTCRARVLNTARRPCDSSSMPGQEWLAWQVRSLDSSLYFNRLCRSSSRESRASHRANDSFIRGARK
jgi:hypothetical protein